MPCSQRKARILLKQNKATIYKYNPFTIRLNYCSGESNQICKIGIDTGSKNIGIAITSNKNVLFKGEIELRQDVKSNIYLRKEYRRARRSRKTRYRKARFLNRKKKKDWLPPSIESRISITFRWIDLFLELVPQKELYIEVGKFDIQKMINQNIKNEEYQQGDKFGYYNTRYYVFDRDNYTCQVCKKSNNKILQTHHIIYKSNGGTNRAENLITICSECHTSNNHKEGNILWKWQIEKKKTKQYKDPPFMNIIRRRIFIKYPMAKIVYGSETSYVRKEMKLEKTHYNDAIVISGIRKIKENNSEWLLIKQCRKKKRSLHEATPRKGKKQPNAIQKRNAKNKPFYRGFYLNDSVSVNELCKHGYVCGFTNGGAFVKDEVGEYIRMEGKSYYQLPIYLLKKTNHNNNWVFINNKGAK